jgi:hypothetical protein
MLKAIARNFVEALDGFGEFACLIYGDHFYGKPTFHQVADATFAHQQLSCVIMDAGPENRRVALQRFMKPLLASETLTGYWPEGHPSRSAGRRCLFRLN